MIYADLCSNIWTSQWVNNDNDYRINKWVAGETKEMIKDLLSASDVDANTMIALCSALHFKGSWENPFDAPFEDDFHLSESETVKTQLMQKKVIITIVPFLNFS